VSDQDERPVSESDEIAYLRSTPVETVLGNHFFVLLQLAALQLSSTPPNLSGAQLVIDTIAAMLAAGGAAVIVRNSEPPKIVVNAGHRASSHTWEELSQFQVDALTAELKKLPARDVAIFCWKLCDDLALTFDNAFESAHWKSGIETPLFDDSVGLTIGPADDPGAATLRKAIQAATGIDAKLVDARILENRIALVIGRK